MFSDAVRREFVLSDELMYEWLKSTNMALKAFVAKYHRTLDIYLRHM